MRMSKAEILQEIPRLSHEERREIVRLIFQMEQEAEALADCDRLALERFKMLDAMEADGEFHARFSAAARHYLFRILNRRAPPALEDGRVWYVSPNLDAEAMHAAAQMLVGQHDFTTFRAAECQSASPVKTLDRLDVSRRADEIHIEASARSFLHHQIRSFAGTLKLVGEGKWSPRDVAGALAAKDRARCGPVSPPDGLYLVRVDY